MPEQRALIMGGLEFVGSFVARNLLEERIADQVICLDHFGRYASSVEPGFIDYRHLRLLGISDRVVNERGDARY
jgi:nucleoside-diphosphate-sugar epimerase